MAKNEKEVSGPSGKANTTNSKNNASAKKSPQSEGLNPNNMFWAIKYKDDIPEKLVILHFDESMMKAMELKSEKLHKHVTG
ncbi:hypothetical protein [Bracoviriform inaniti]|uniref:Uncharacterized protein n=1 Tax=Bracoviriform inaniti TaxID=36344 RepID=O92525_9VIRU|nr:hypothetical protein [Bracoviriform inaniti]UUG47225.1 ORF12 [Bracoviriform inaniti]CAA91235.2 hypothetical protein [Bracoviriform inaniti]